MNDNNIKYFEFRMYSTVHLIYLAYSSLILKNCYLINTNFVNKGKAIKNQFRVEN